MAKRPRSNEPIRIETHRELRGNIRRICERFNADPGLARLLLVNPVLAFEDAGVELTPELKEHIINRLRFPPKLVERLARLEAEIREELQSLGIDAALPLSAEQRAKVLFDVLKLSPVPAASGRTSTGAAPDAPAPRLDAKAYRTQHPLAAKLAEYERARQGSLLFHTRTTYEAYKAGQRQHRWLVGIRFKV
jgi:hypothetical protein